MSSRLRVHSLWRKIEVISSNGVPVRSFPIDNAGRLLVYKLRNKRRNLQPPTSILNDIPKCSLTKTEDSSPTHSSSEDSSHEYSSNYSNTYFQEILQIDQNDKNLEKNSTEEEKASFQNNFDEHEAKSDQEDILTNYLSDYNSCNIFNEGEDPLSSDFSSECHSDCSCCCCCCCDYLWYKEFN